MGAGLRHRAAMRTDYRWQSATVLATALDTALRPKAASLLFRLQKARIATRRALLCWALIFMMGMSS